eukprot:NODE_248_length_12985_cov_0.286357.p7 type:complete len:136 gc:universal NODE_248_length_12985_cov_0.286357:12772-12365(-)
MKILETMINEKMKEEYFNQAKKLKLSCFPNFIPGHINFEDSIDVKNPKGPKFTYYSDGYLVSSRKDEEECKYTQETVKKKEGLRSLLNLENYDKFIGIDPGVKTPLFGAYENTQTHFNSEVDLLEYLELPENVLN